MKKLMLLIFCLAFTMHAMASDKSKEEPTQHLRIADVTSLIDAKKIFIEKTSEIKSKKRLDPLELQQIHIITYTLEKSVAYFVENLKDERQGLANEIALVVEDIHISSENNRKLMTEDHLDKYFDLAEQLVSGF